jgi:hypothetical protein
VEITAGAFSVLVLAVDATEREQGVIEERFGFFVFASAEVGGGSAVLPEDFVAGGAVGDGIWAVDGDVTGQSERGSAWSCGAAADEQGGCGEAGQKIFFYYDVQRNGSGKVFSFKFSDVHHGDTERGDAENVLKPLTPSLSPLKYVRGEGDGIRG